MQPKPNDMNCKIFTVIALTSSMLMWSQKKSTPVKKVVTKTPTTTQVVNHPKLYDQLPDLIPFRKNGKMGFVNQENKIVIQPEYNMVAFFYEDCNLLSSSNPKVQKFGTSDYASATIDRVDYRIDKSGKKVYTFKKTDLGTCEKEYKKQKFHAYIQNGYYGLIEDEKFKNPHDYRHFSIYPQYNYLHVLEGDDLENPRMVATVNDSFGVIDKDNKVVIPFQYADIKRNFAYKMGKMFEVSKDGKNYFFVDENNTIFYP